MTPRRATAYVLEGSLDGGNWQRLAGVKNRAKRIVDHLHFPPTSVKFLRLKETAATQGEPPLLEELETSGRPRRSAAGRTSGQSSILKPSFSVTW